MSLIKGLWTHVDIISEIAQVQLLGISVYCISQIHSAFNHWTYLVLGTQMYPHIFPSNNVMIEEEGEEREQGKR